MIYTSYFGNIKNIPKDYTTIAISRTVPAWYFGLRDIELAPSKATVMEYKNTQNFEDLVINYGYKLMQIDFSKRLEDWKTKNVVLLCWESKHNQCHRSVLAEWLNWKYNVEIKELR